MTQLQDHIHNVEAGQARPVGWAELCVPQNGVRGGAHGHAPLTLLLHRARVRVLPPGVQLDGHSTFQGTCLHTLHTL